ncbi:hypothetical protein [Plantactinospora sp. WMMB782]|uniref:hypothetical protein n=1 Tax=Plantactinospora sp. WMMB782 TaxID=3404121 RepID=UPI003B931B34
MRQAAPRPVRRIIVAIVAVLTVVATSSGCNVNDSPEEREDSNAVAAQIQETLAQRPEVVEVKVTYQNNISASAVAGVTITVKAGSDMEPVIEEAVRLLWLSTLHPLGVIRIGANEVEAKQRGIDRTINPTGADKAALEQKYGPRPPE